MSTVQINDVAPVHSRVSWGAIFAGAVTAITLYLVLSVLGVAIGMTVSNRTDESSLNTGAAIWAAFTLMLSLFLGGWVASQCTTNETKMEAAVYGVIVWGTMFALMAWPLASRLRLGVTDLMNVVNTTQNAAFTDEELRAAGFSADQIASQRGNFDKLRGRGLEAAGNMREVANDPRAVSSAWWVFGGILLSLLASVAGAMTGAGPELRIVSGGTRAVFVARRTTTSNARTEEPAHT